MDKLHTILQHYSILPQGVVHVTDRLYQIKASGKQYALKRSNLDESQVKNWLQAYHLAQEKNLHKIIPVYLTNQQELYVKAENVIYYLTPWVEGKIIAFNKRNLETIFRNLGDIHLRTKRFHPLDQEHLKKNFQPYQKKCNNDESRLLQKIERIEKNRYPSPLDLQILTHYRDISQALKTSQLLVDQMIRYGEDEERWGTSLVHGNLGIEHCFEEYLINWERTSIDHPIHDLTYFFHAEATGFYNYADLLIEAFPAYLEENPINRLESALLSLHLLNTSQYLDDILQESKGQRSYSSMIDQTINAEKMYKKITFGLKFNSQLATWSKVENAD